MAMQAPVPRSSTALAASQLVRPLPASVSQRSPLGALPLRSTADEPRRVAPTAAGFVAAGAAAAFVARTPRGSRKQRMAKQRVARCVYAEEPTEAEKENHEEEVDELLMGMIEGNERFVKKLNAGEKRPSSRKEAIMREIRFKPQPPKAIVLSDARAYAEVSDLFDCKLRQLESIKVLGNTCSPNDTVMGSVEFCVSVYHPPLLLVMGNTKNDVIEGAVRRAMEAAGRTDAPHKAGASGDLALYDKVALAARDALSQLPNAPFERLCELATELNVWNTIETLMTSSGYIQRQIQMGKMTMQGAVLSVETGKVQFLGRHPYEQALLQKRVRMDMIRDAASPRVPPDQALAQLVAGNRRYGLGSRSFGNKLDQELLMQLGGGGQNPIAAVLGCADSRAPLELIFDLRPGDLFVLRDAGNSLAAMSTSLIGSMEFALAVLGTQLVVVTGHTKCGAVTTAVKSAIAGDFKSYPGSIGQVLANLIGSANKAIDQLPHGTLEEQITLATELNVQDTIEKLIQNSPIVRDCLAKGKLQIHGSVYDIFKGEVKWLGEHPDQEKLVGSRLPLLQWKAATYTRATEGRSVYGKSRFWLHGPADSVIKKLIAGNGRFLDGTSESGRTAVGDPMALVISTADAKVSCEQVFDVNPGQLIVQRCMGNIAGHQGGTTFASIEYAVARWSPKCIVVLGDGDCVSITTALEQVRGHDVNPAMSRVLEMVQPAALRALNQVESQDGVPRSAAGEAMKIKQLTVELNVFYTIECLLTHSEIVREAVKSGKLELHGAVLDRLTGGVEFIGEHPMLETLISQPEEATVSA